MATPQKHLSLLVIREATQPPSVEDTRPTPLALALRHRHVKPGLGHSLAFAFAIGFDAIAATVLLGGYVLSSRSSFSAPDSCRESRWVGRSPVRRAGTGFTVTNILATDLSVRSALPQSTRSCH